MGWVGSGSDAGLLTGSATRVRSRSTAKIAFCVRGVITPRAGKPVSALPVRSVDAEEVEGSPVREVCGRYHRPLQEQVGSEPSRCRSRKSTTRVWLGAALREDEARLLQGLESAGKSPA